MENKTNVSVRLFMTFCIVLLILAGMATVLAINIDLQWSSPDFQGGGVVGGTERGIVVGVVFLYFILPALLISFAFSFVASSKIKNNGPQDAKLVFYTRVCLGIVLAVNLIFLLFTLL